MSEFNEENIDGFDSNEEEIFNHWAGPDHEENKKMLKFSVDLITEVTSDLSVLINEQIKDYVDSFKAQCIVLKKGDFTDEMRKDLLQFLRGCIMSTEAIEKRIQQLIQSYQKGSKQVLNDFAEKGLEIPDQLDLNIVDDDIEEMLNKITDSINNKNNH